MGALLVRQKLYCKTPRAGEMLVNEALKNCKGVVTGTLDRDHRLCTFGPEQDALAMVVKSVHDSMYNPEIDNESARWLVCVAFIKGLCNVIDALKNMHRLKYVHGDVRLENMAMFDGSIKMFDFGLSARMDVDGIADWYRKCGLEQFRLDNIHPSRIRRQVRPNYGRLFAPSMQDDIYRAFALFSIAINELDPDALPIEPMSFGVNEALGQGLEGLAIFNAATNDGTPYVNLGPTVKGIGVTTMLLNVCGVVFQCVPNDDEKMRVWTELVALFRTYYAVQAMSEQSDQLRQSKPLVILHQGKILHKRARQDLIE
jgi:hypothetical protein